MQTIICQLCNSSILVRNPKMQKYCSPCSNIRDAERKRKWANADYQKRRKDPDTIARRNYLNHARNKVLRNLGVDASKENRFGDNLPPSTKTLLWNVVLEYPFDYCLSKNSIFRMNSGGHVFLRQERKRSMEKVGFLISNLISENKIQVAQNKVWLDFFIEKPDFRGDAVNFVDSLCDAIKMGVGIDDRWFCVGTIDWRIVKVDPKIYIRIGQDSSENVQCCSYCGRMLSFEKFGRRSNSSRAPNNIARVCFGCTRVEDGYRRKENREKSNLDKNKKL